MIAEKQKLCTKDPRLEFSRNDQASRESCLPGKIRSKE